MMSAAAADGWRNLRRSRKPPAWGWGPPRDLTAGHADGAAGFEPPFAETTTGTTTDWLATVPDKRPFVHTPLQ
jgi:hypothetical protein